MRFFLCDMSLNIADSKSSEKPQGNTIFDYIFWEAFLSFSHKDSKLNFAKSGYAMIWKSTAKLIGKIPYSFLRSSVGFDINWRKNLFRRHNVIIYLQINFTVYILHRYCPV